MGDFNKEELQVAIKDIIADELKQATSAIEERFVPRADPTEIIASPEDNLVADAKGGFKDMGHFFRELIAEGASGDQPGSLKAWNQAVSKTAGYMEEGDLSQGGFLVPEEFKATLLQTALEASIVRSRATVIPMQTNRVVIPALVDDDHSTDFYGGVVIYRTAEKGTKTPKNPVFGKVGLTLHKLTGLCYITDELLQDSPISIEPVIRATFGAAIAFTEDYDFLRGDGSNMALGAFDASNPSRILVTKETGQAADTIVAENILKMWSRLYPAGQSKAVWLANNNTFPQLATLSIAVGTGGIPIWIPGNDLSKTPNGSLLGRPVILTEKMATVGDACDIGLADFSQYLIGQKGGVQFASSIHVRFVTDETAFRFVMRYDGQPWWLSVLTPKEGSTLSPFVGLNERT